MGFGWVQADMARSILTTVPVHASPWVSSQPLFMRRCAPVAVRWPRERRNQICVSSLALYEGINVLTVAMVIYVLDRFMCFWVLWFPGAPKPRPGEPGAGQGVGLGWITWRARQILPLCILRSSAGGLALGQGDSRGFSGCYS